jgi:large-conductance mechanosensitive channel
MSAAGAAGWMRSGGAFAVTVGIGYAACTLAFWAWPDLAMNFMNSLFHGLDFRKLQAGPKLFEFGAFLYALIGIVAWAFFLGVVYSAVGGRRE